MRKLTAKLLVAAALAVVPLAAPVALAPGAHADQCADDGDHHNLGTCTDIAGDIAMGAPVAEADDAAAQEAAGQPPCYSPGGVPFYTPGPQPCP
jgi:hypothetical protein